MALCVATRLTNVSVASSCSWLKVSLSCVQRHAAFGKRVFCSSTFGLNLSEDAAAKSPFLRILSAEVSDAEYERQISRLVQRK